MTDMEEIMELRAYLADGSLSDDLRKKATHSLWLAEEAVFRAGLQELEQRLTEKVLRALVLKVMSRKLERVRQMEAEEYRKQDELRAKGVPFKERRSMLNEKCIELCKAEEFKLLCDSKYFKLRPLREWFGEEEYWSAKRMGLEFVISFNLERVYYVPKDHHE